MTPIAIVTGGNSGIGRATALKLAAEGFDVGITYHSGRERAEAVAQEIERLGRRVVIAEQDLAKPESADRAIHELTDRLGGLTAFVNNAAISYRCAFLDMPLNEWLRVIAVNLSASFVCAQCAAQYLVALARGGAIINISSILDREVLEGGAAYCASKAALSQLTRVMALELGRHRIRVNGIAPGETATPMNLKGEVDAASVQRPVTPLGRPGYAGEVASAVAFLLSKESAYITGDILLVDGGPALHVGPQSLQATLGKPAPPEPRPALAIYPSRPRP